MNRNFFPVFLVILIDLISYTMLIPIFPYRAQTFGVGGTEVTLLLAVYAFMQLLFNPIWGGLSDRYGRRPFMILSSGGAAFSYALFAAAGNYPLLLISRIFGGMLTANIPVAQSMFADLTPPEKRTKGMAFFGVAFGVAFVLGPALGGWISQWGYAMVAWVGMGLSLVNILLCIFLLKETRWLQSRRVAETEKFSLSKVLLSPFQHLRLIKKHDVLGLIILYFIFIFASSFLESTFSLYLKNHRFMSSLQVGLLLGFYGLVIIFIQGYAVRRLTLLWGDRIVIFIGCLFALVGFMLFPISKPVAELMLTVVFLGTGLGILYTALIAATSRRVPADAQGRILGISAAVASLSRATGPLWAGYAYDHITYQAPFTSGALILMIMALLIMFGVIHVRPAVVQER